MYIQDDEGFVRTGWHILNRPMFAFNNTYILWLILQSLINLVTQSTLCASLSRRVKNNRKWCVKCVTFESGVYFGSNKPRITPHTIYLIVNPLMFWYLFYTQCRPILTRTPVFADFEIDAEPRITMPQENVVESKK